jgi:lipid II:glycine glycyltransferase (peptidoglycan interpeptide bridge formation enzyme)
MVHGQLSIVNYQKSIRELYLWCLCVIMLSNMSQNQQLSTTDGSLADDRWDAFVAGHPQGHLLQSSRWAALKCRFGWRAERVALAEDGQIVAGGQILLRRLPWGQHLAYVPKGPLLNWQQAGQVGALLAALQATARPYRPVLLKIEPDLPDSPLLDLLLGSYGFQRGHSVQPRSTIHIDLAQGADAALAGMKQKWRYNVRLAARRHVTVRRGTAADLTAFHSLNRETSQRDGFGVHDPAYYETAFQLFDRDNTACWLFAEYEHQPLAAIVVFALGRKSWYMWGASSSLERQRMPNHALQWAGMQWALEQGCSCYDLWGIPDQVGVDPEAHAEDYAQQRGGLWGVYRFKQGFGGRVVRYTGAWDLVLSPLGNRLYDWIRGKRG